MEDEDLQIREAVARFLTESEGNTQEGWDGLRPNFNINGSLITSQIHSLDGHKKMSRGEEFRVSIDLPTGRLEGVTDYLKIGAEFTLQGGSKVYAKGRIIKV
ncbi:MAG: hypothetical protein N2C14_04875 [Planctomycetales bacterium]